MGELAAITLGLPFTLVLTQPNAYRKREKREQRARKKQEETTPAVSPVPFFTSKAVSSKMPEPRVPQLRFDEASDELRTAARNVPPHRTNNAPAQR